MNSVNELVTKSLFHSPLIAVLVLSTGCGERAGGSDASGSAGSANQTATTGSGGMTGSGGSTGTAQGGTGTAAGGTGTAGSTGTAGAMGSGGAAGSAGSTSSGGTLGVAGTTGDAGSSEVAGAGGSSATSGSGGEGGAAGGGGSSDTGGAAGSGGSGGTMGEAGCNAAGGDSSGGSGGDPPTELFSFFVTSQDAMIELSGNELGFGGDLRFGETGPGAGLRGADKICTAIAEMSMPGAGAKGWRAFLSATTDGSCGGGRVDAVDRVGSGPWYDRLGRLVAENPEALLMDRRPEGADPAIANDLPDEYGVPNHCASGVCQDNHDTLTGVVELDETLSLRDTCEDWTSAVPEAGYPVVGHSWGSQAIPSWFDAHTNRGCAPGGTLVEELPSTMTVGSGGGYGGIYCFALVP